MRNFVTVVVKHRVWGDGRIWIDRAKTKVLRDTGGWYVVVGRSPTEDARVLFRPAQDLVVIEQDGAFLRIPFLAGEATFTWQGLAYHIGTMVMGLLRIDQSGRRVASGVVTVSGVRFSVVETELLPLIRPLAWGLTLRSEDIARDSRRANVGAASG